jgi:hypothetical protein
MDRVLLLADGDYEILSRPFPWRLLPPHYDRELWSGRPVKEFVALAKLLRRGGFQLFPVSRPPHLDGREPLEVLKIGKCQLDRDSRLMRQYGSRNGSEWNLRNLEMVEYYDQYMDLGRKTWYVNLRYGEGQAQFRRLLHEHGPLFVKSLVKGHSAIVTSADTYLREFGDLSLVDADSLTLLVSEVIRIRQIEAAIEGRTVSRTDEWRHYVYRGRRLVTIHAFECDPRRTSAAHRDANIQHAEAVIEKLRGTDFATSYVLDTCTLEAGGCAVVEANFFFSSGIYDPAALGPIAQAILAGAA